MNISQFTAPWRRFEPARLAAWSTALLVVALAYSLAQLTWRVWPGAQADRVLAPMTGPIVSADGGRGARQGLDALAALHLFGEAGPAAARPSPIDAPETHLDLALHGVIAGEGEMSFAIIASGGRDERAYRVGANLPGGAVLRDIYPDRVILERNGRFETLKLPREAAAATPSAKGAAAGTLSPALQSKLRGYRERLREDPQAAFQLIQVSPVVADGRLTGYRIAPRAEQDLFRRLGLRPGDVVTQVNGLALNDPSKLGEALQQLSRADRLVLTVQRGGRAQTVTVRLQ